MLKILVVEDEPVDQKLAHLVLTSEGHSVVQADEAITALDEIARNPPEVILLDLRLNGTDGLDLARHLKKNPQTRNIAIVAVTAYPNVFSRQDALTAGCDAYIVKPINTRTLPQQIAEAAARTR